MSEAELLDAQYAEHRPVAVYCLFSGGHDSLAATHVGATWAKSRGIPFSVAHLNTGIGIEQTRQFVRQTCVMEGWNLRELRADRETQTYEYIVRRYGFPGPGGHPYLYRRLKERKLERLVREAKVGHSRSARVMLITGVRRQESERRMGHGDFQRRRGAQVWSSPLEHWSKVDVNEYLEANELPRNQVVDLLHLSGECLCGAFAKVGERAELEHWFPEEFARILELEDMVAEAGQVSRIWGYSASFASELNPAQEVLPLCLDCGP